MSAASTRRGLHKGAVYGRGGALGALLEHGGADLDAVDRVGTTALMRAALYGEAVVAAQLVDAGADATPRAIGGEFQGMTALEIAEAKGKAEVAALLREGEPAVRPPTPTPPAPFELIPSNPAIAGRLGLRVFPRFHGAC